jgi:hypothetical protein
VLLFKRQPTLLERGRELFLFGSTTIIGVVQPCFGVLMVALPAVADGTIGKVELLGNLGKRLSLLMACDNLLA